MYCIVPLISLTHVLFFPSSDLWMSQPLSSWVATLLPSTTAPKAATFPSKDSLETCASVTLSWTFPALSHLKECRQASPLRMTHVQVHLVRIWPSVCPVDSPMCVCVGHHSLGRTARMVRNQLPFGLVVCVYVCLFVERDFE